MDNLQIRHGNNVLGDFIEVELSKQIYSTITIMKVCYEFTEQYSIHILQKNKDAFLLHFYAKSEQPNQAFDLRSFLDNLLEQELRQLVIDETKEIRTTIINKAFASIKTTHRNKPHPDLFIQKG